MKYNEALHTIGSRLRLAMHAKNIYTNDLADATNIDPGNIAAYLDEREIPSLEQCKSMAEVLGVVPDWLACLDNSTPIHVALFKGRGKVPSEEWAPVKEYADFILKSYEKKNH